MIYVIAGLPGAGKTYCAVHFAIERWKKDKNHKIFSNFPIFWKGVSSYIWKPEYVSEDLFNSTVIIDEAYRDYNSRNYKDFNADSHIAFATSRHNGMDYYFIAQSVQRIDTVIREIANEIFLVGNIHIPFNGRPLWFTIDSYDGIEALKMRAVAGKKAVLRTFRIRFRKEVALSYDTLQFRKDSDNEFIGEKWFKEPDKTDGPRFRFARLNMLRPSVIWMRIRTALRRIYSDNNPQPRSVNDTTNSPVHWNDSRSHYLHSLYTNIRATCRRVRQRTKYDLYEPRGLAREVIYRNWLLWKPIFSFFSTRCPRASISIYGEHGEGLNQDPAGPNPHESLRFGAPPAEALIRPLLMPMEPLKQPTAVTPPPSGLWGSRLDRIGSISKDELMSRLK